MITRAAMAAEHRENGFREQVALCTTAYDVLRLATSVAMDHEYRHFCAVRLPSSRDTKIAPLILVSSWPEELLRIYDERDLLLQSVAFAVVRSSTRPVMWSCEQGTKHYLEGTKAKTAALFCSFGLRNGVHFSVQDPDGKRGVVTFAGNRPVPDEPELAQLNFFANLAYERLSELKKGLSRSKSQKLSAREKECLMWTASGKTSAEIAIILKLSEHTVNHYLTAACQKLEATNRAHAVYKATRAGLFD